MIYLVEYRMDFFAIEHVVDLYLIYFELILVKIPIDIVQWDLLDSYKHIYYVNNQTEEICLKAG